MPPTFKQVIKRNIFNLLRIYRQFLIHSRDNLSLVIPSNKMIENWLEVVFIAMLWWIYLLDMCKLQTIGQFT